MRGPELWMQLVSPYEDKVLHVCLQKIESLGDSCTKLKWTVLIVFTFLYSRGFTYPPLTLFVPLDSRVTLERKQKLSQYYISMNLQLNSSRPHASHSFGIWHQWDAALGVILSAEVATLTRWKKNDHCGISEMSAIPQLISSYPKCMSIPERTPRGISTVTRKENKIKKI